VPGQAFCLVADRNDRRELLTDALIPASGQIVLQLGEALVDCFDESTMRHVEALNVGATAWLRHGPAAAGPVRIFARGEADAIPDHVDGSSTPAKLNKADSPSVTRQAAARRCHRLVLEVWGGSSTYWS
jgi:hypothetical protein